MTKDELRNKAYEIATSNSLTEELDYDAIQSISDEALVGMAWEPFEFWSANDLHEHLAQIATEIIDAFKQFVK